MNKTKLFSILAIVLVVMVALTPLVSAFDKTQYNPDTSDSDGIRNSGRKILGIIQVVGNLVAVGMLLLLGIKYMTGSAEEKAANKKSMMPYFIGAIFLFAGVNLVAVVADWAPKLVK